MSVEPLAEQPLADCYRPWCIRRIESGVSPGCIVAFDDERGESILESVAMCLENAELVLNEEERERIERTRCAEPDEMCGAYVEVRPEYRGALVSYRAVDTIGGDDEIGVVTAMDRFERLQACDVAVEANVDHE